MAWAEIENLRDRVIDAEKRAEEYFDRYADCLNDFKSRDSDSFESKKANTSLIK